MIPSRVRKLRSLFLRSESRAILEASQKEALSRNLRGWDKGVKQRDAPVQPVVPQKKGPEELPATSPQEKPSAAILLETRLVVRAGIPVRSWRRGLSLKRAGCAGSFLTLPAHGP